MLSNDNFSPSRVRAVLPSGNIRHLEAEKDKYHMGTLTKVKFNLFQGKHVYNKIAKFKSMLVSHIIYSISLQHTLTTKTVVSYARE